MTQKAQQNRWMDPIGGWGQNKDSQEAGGQENNREMGNLCFKRESCPRSLCIVFSWEDSQVSQGQANLQMLK